ncbi:MAG: ABC transporter permease [Defluviitaleaceae bacterium]|nr:ABC transporter permease [Defluviitaleaceae bacterium]MCL2262641.1 ABC transporter permease [Defluviitaleaceae bacterium]
MTMVAFTGAVELGLIFALLALGIFVAYRILGVPDLTVEGSFAAGASVGAMLVVAGHPFLGLVASAAVGAGAGLVTSVLQTKLKVQPILAGILTMTASYSVNLYIMGGRSNIPLLREETVFTAAGRVMNNERLLFSLFVTVLVGAALGLFFHTRLGLALRATGDNDEMVRASSINSAFTKTVGLCIANGIAGLSGGLIAQYQGFADINMGFGMVVVAMASLIIGEAVFGRRSVIWNIASVIVGAVIYRLILAFALSFRFNPANLRAISAIIVAAAISFPAIKRQWELFMLKRRAKRGAKSA